MSGRAWKSRDLVFVQDLGDLKDCCRAPVATRAGVKSGVALPIMVKGEVMGMMDFFATETLEPVEERFDALRNVGRIVTDSFERIAISQHQTESTANTSAVNHVLEAMGNAKTCNEAARAALDTVRDAFGWAYGSYWVRDEKENALKFAVSPARSTKSSPRHRRSALPRRRRPEWPRLEESRPILRRGSRGHERLLPCPSRQARRSEIRHCIPDDRRRPDFRNDGFLRAGNALALG